MLKLCKDWIKFTRSLLRVMTFFRSFFASGIGFPLFPQIFYIIIYYTLYNDPAAHQRAAGFEPGTSAPEVWCATTSLMTLFLPRRTPASFMKGEVMTRSQGSCRARAHSSSAIKWVWATRRKLKKLPKSIIFCLAQNFLLTVLTWT